MAGFFTVSTFVYFSYVTQYDTSDISRSGARTGRGVRDIEVLLQRYSFNCVLTEGLNTKNISQSSSTAVRFL